MLLHDIFSCRARHTLCFPLRTLTGHTRTKRGSQKSITLAAVWFFVGVLDDKGRDLRLSDDDVVEGRRGCDTNRRF